MTPGKAFSILLIIRATNGCLVSSLLCSLSIMYSIGLRWMLCSDYTITFEMSRPMRSPNQSPKTNIVSNLTKIGITMSAQAADIMVLSSNINSVLSSPNTISLMWSIMSQNPAITVCNNFRFYFVGTNLFLDLLEKFSSLMKMASLYQTIMAAVSIIASLGFRIKNVKNMPKNRVWSGFFQFITSRR